jgi:amino acid transporter
MSIARNNEEATSVSLSRDLRLFDITMIGVGGMIGAGIFVLTGIAAGVAGPALVAAFLLNGLVTSLTAMAYAELGSAFPAAGGGYVWVKAAIGGGIGFLAGWMGWFASAVAGSLYSLAFGHFATELWLAAGLPVYGLPDEVISLIFTALVVIAFTYINYRGASEAGAIGNIVTLSKIVILAIFVLFGVLAMLRFNVWQERFTTGLLPNGIPGILVAMGLTFIAFEGYEIIAQSGEEVMNPERNIPRATFYSIGIAVIIYILVAFTAIGAIQVPEGLNLKAYQYLGQQKETAIVEAADQFFPFGVGATILLISAVVSTMSALNAVTYSASRVAFAMGRDRNLPVIFASVHPTRRTPSWAVIFSGVLIGGMALLLRIEAVAAASSLMFLFMFMQVNLSLMVMRSKRPDMKRTFRVPFYPVVPILALLSQVVLAIYLFTFSPEAWYTALVWIGVGLVVYYLFFARLEAMEEPTKVLHEEIVAITDYSVLIPVANHSQARRLAILGSAIAAPNNGELFALHVIHVPRQLGLGEGRLFLRQGKPILETVIENREFDVPVRTMIRLGRNVGHAIMEAARERDANVLLLGWPGFTRSPGRAFGSVIDILAANPPCDLVVVHFQRREPPKRILLPMRGVRNAGLAMRLAIAQARAYEEESGHQSEITLLKVLRRGSPPNKHEFTRVMLTEVTERFDYPRLNVEIVEADDIIEEILRQSEAYNLVIIGATEERLWEQRLFGGVTERLAVECPKTVMMIKRSLPIRSRLAPLVQILRPQQEPEAPTPVPEEA